MSDYDYDDYEPSYRKRILKKRRNSTFRWVILGSILFFLGIAVWAWLEIAQGMPTLDQLENPRPEMATRIISTDGEPIDQYFIKNRTTVKLREVPKDLINALIATEDRSFWDHWGLDLWRNLRAIWIDVITLSPKQGASTITQQLAKNLYLSHEKSVMRKLREAFTAVQIEKTHTKREILEMYLNVVYLGRGAYGVQVASQMYFGKDVKQLTTAQAAFLVGILKGPENYDPEENYDKAMQRRNIVLDAMVEAGFMTPEKANKVKQEPIKVQALKGYEGIAPHFVEMIRQDLTKRPELQGYDLYRDGLIVYTTLNAELQRAANKAVDEHVKDYQARVVDKRWNWAAHKGLLDTIIFKAIKGHTAYRQADNSADRLAIEKKLRADTKFVDSVKHAEIRMQVGFVCLDNVTGQILAMVGSSNFASARYGLNHVTQIWRQPGSSFKPVIYSSAFENGASPETSVSNEPISMADGDRVWSPRNFEGEASGGIVPIKTAIQFSYNLAAIHAMLELTSTRDVVRMAKRMGIRSNIPAYPSIALGTAEVTPLELTSAYSIFPNDGVRATPYAILRVEDRNGKVLYRAKPEYEHVIEPKYARMMTSCLMAVVDHGTAVRIRSMFHYPAAGKTGTTQNYGDAWFMGYTPHFTAGVWVGFDDKRVSFSGADGQGGRAAAPIWGRFMKYAYDALKPAVTYFVTDYTNAPGPRPLPRIDTSSDNVPNYRPIETIPIRRPEPVHSDSQSTRIVPPIVEPPKPKQGIPRAPSDQPTERPADRGNSPVVVPGLGNAPKATPPGQQNAPIPKASPHERKPKDESNGTDRTN